MFQLVPHRTRTVLFWIVLILKLLIPLSLNLIQYSLNLIQFSGLVHIVLRGCPFFQLYDFFNKIKDKSWIKPARLKLLQLSYKLCLFSR
jgi:Trk-type K+ transport system membrane component